MSKVTTENGVAALEVNEAAPQPLEYQTGDDAADAFLRRWSEEDPVEQASDAPEEEEESEVSEAEEAEDEAEEAVESEEDTEADPEDGSEEDAEAEDDEEVDEKPVKKKALDDDAVVKVKVDDDELEVSVKDLKRLYGQEAALTRKSQEVAAKRKEAEQQATVLSASLERLYQKAAERWKPYAEIDMLVASKQLDAEQFAALRAEANAAYEDFRFISEEAANHVKQTQAQQQQFLQEAAKDAVKVLKEAIPGWSSSLYDNIREYAISNGMDSNVVNNLVDPVAIQLIHKARLYDESKKIATKKKVATPKKVMKTTNTLQPSDVKSDKVSKTTNRLRQTGSLDDATDLFLSRWASDE